jgi:hypothetical protein
VYSAFPRPRSRQTWPVALSYLNVLLARSRCKFRGPQWTQRSPSRRGQSDIKPPFTYVRRSIAMPRQSNYCFMNLFSNMSALIRPKHFISLHQKSVRSKAE